MVAANYGIDGGWFGLRTTKNLPALFPDINGTADKRAQFFTSGQNLEINDISNFKDGIAVSKFKNITKDNSQGSSLTWVDIDFPLFRLAEQYLIYAEAAARGTSGEEKANAVTYINRLRYRAYGNNTGNINVNDLTPEFILDERARELYWEGFRRTDLIRFNRFTEGTYLWPWKGDVKGGTGVADYKKLYPIPSADLSSNPNLVQNTGY